MSAPNPGLDTIGRVSGRRNAYLGSTLYGPSSLVAPNLYNSSVDPVTYNGFQWTLSAGVSWGRFISGEPFIILPPAGVQVTGVTPGPTVVTGFTSAAGQAASSGVTFYINGSMKNPTPWWEQKVLNWDLGTLGYIVKDYVYDERISNISKPVGDPHADKLNHGAAMNLHTNMAAWLNFPVGLSAGDVLVSAKSNFDSDYRLHIQPQGQNIYVSWTTPNIYRMCIEKFGILTALSSSPTTSDCYRPPVFWNGASFADRPIFYKRNYSKQTENYIIPFPEKDIKGNDLLVSNPQVTLETESWNSDVNDLWCSSHVPYFSGTHGQLGTPAYDAFNSDTTTFRSGYNGYGMKIKDKMMQSIFVPWVTAANRSRARDKVVQFCIDSWGVINGKGLSDGAGGVNSCTNRPWVVFLGWLYGRNDITNFHQNAQLLERLAPGLTGNFAPSKYKVPSDHFIKSLTCQEYEQRYKMYGSGVTGIDGFTAWIATNPSQDLYHGLTAVSISITGNTGMGWKYKYSGITCAYAYTATSITRDGRTVPGSFGTIVAHRDFVGRLNALGPGSGLPGPATLPMTLSSSGTLTRKCFNAKDDCHEYWGFEKSALYGSNIEIVSGAGSGATVYKIIDANNTFLARKTPVEGEEEELVIPTNSVASIRYASFVLDRDFQNGVPDNTSQFKIYPIAANEILFGFSANPWLAEFGTTAQTDSLVTQYSQPSYNNIADEPIVKHYSLQKYLGITQDQFLIDYTEAMYFDEDVPNYIRRRKSFGSAYVGSIFSSGNILGGAVVAKMLGLTGDQFFPDSIDDLPGASDFDPALPMDGITLEFTPGIVPEYQVQFGSGDTYSGWGIVFDEPQTILKVKAVIDDKIFIDKTAPGIYSLGKELRIQNGPFLTNLLVNDNDFDLDQVLFYDFGDIRDNTTLNVTTSSKYVRNFPSIKEMAETSPPTEVKWRIVSSKYSMAGAAGILPNRGQTSKLTTTYGQATLNRPLTVSGVDENLYLTFVGDYGSALDFSNLWYCVSSPIIPADTTINGKVVLPLKMAEEYVLTNWKKPTSSIIKGSNTVIVDIPSNILPHGSTFPDYSINTDDKLIFFRFLTDNYNTIFPMVSLPVPAQSGITLSPISQTHYYGWTGGDLYKEYKIDIVTLGNSNGNAGYFRYVFNNSTSDYRKLAYNHFRLYHNNYFELETHFGLDAMETFVENGDGTKSPFIFHHSGYRYNSFVTGDDNNNYFSPKSGGLKINIEENNNETSGFFTYYVHGQTMNFIMPPNPQTLLWCTDSTS